MVLSVFEPLIQSLRVRGLPALKLSNALKSLLPTDGILPNTFFFNVQTEQRLNGSESATQAFCDGLRDIRNNDAIAWLLVAADVLGDVELVSFIRLKAVEELTNKNQLELQRIFTLCKEISELQVVKTLRLRMAVDRLVEFHGDWPDHMGTGDIFIRNECNELAVEIKQLLTGKAGGLVLYGTGGLGKTTSVVYLIRKMMADVLGTTEFGCIKHVIWLNVCNLTMSEGFKDLEFLKLFHNLLVEVKIVPSNCPMTFSAIKSELDSARKTVFVVVDDVFNIGVVRVLSKLGSWIRVLALTRNRTKAFYENLWFNCKSIELPLMSQETIAKMLIDFYHLNDKAGLGDCRKIKRLAAICLGLPLLASVINQAFSNLESPADIDRTYWELVRSSDRLAITDVAADKSGNSSNAEMTVSALLSHSPEFNSLAVTVLYIFMLFGPGETVQAIDLQILWHFEDIGQVRQTCRSAVEASLLRLTADGGYVLHDLLYNAVAQKMKQVFKVTNLRQIKTVLVRDIIDKSCEPLQLAIERDKPQLVRLFLDHLDSLTLSKLCQDNDLIVLKMLLAKLSGFEFWMTSVGSMLESSEATEICCRLIEQCLNAPSFDSFSKLEPLIICSLRNGEKWCHNLLFTAIKMKCDTFVLKLIDSPLSKVSCQNCLDSDGNTALTFAAINGANLNVLRKLATLIDGNLKNQRGETAIWHCAKFSAASEMAQAICSSSPQQIDINARDKISGNSALHNAVFYYSLELVIYLVEQQNADVTLKNRVHGATPIDLALGLQSYIEIGTWLLQRQAAAMTERWFNEASKKYDGTLKILLSEKKTALLENGLRDQESLLQEDETLGRIQTAVAADDLDTLVELKEELPNFSTITRQFNGIGQTTLTIACFHGNSRIARFLLANGADQAIDSQQYNSDSPLMSASRKGHCSIVQMLIGAGADVDLQRNDGVSALHIASQENHVGIVGMLLENGANADSQMSDGAAPLYVATQRGHFEIAKLLIDKGANVDLQKSNGAGALYYASQWGYRKIAELLSDRGASVNLPMKDGATPLHIASGEGHLEIVQLLLQRGADRSLTTIKGESAADFARSKQRNDIARLL